MPACNKPIVVKGQYLPCGQCISCRISKSKEWSLRLEHEKKFHDKAIFLTLTYDDSNLPSDRSLIKRDVQLFIKKLRNKIDKIRYFFVGEYGDITKRPHYHAILFGIGEKDRKVIEECWKKGFVFIGDVERESMEYCTKYIQKKVTGPLAGEHYGSRTKEFSLMSRRPGLGSEYGKKWIEYWFYKGYMIDKGIKKSIPRYYRKLGGEEENEQHRQNARFGYYWKIRSMGIKEGKSPIQILDRIKKGRAQKEIDLKAKLSLKRSKL